MITLESDVSDFLQVFMAYGLAAILEQAVDQPAYVWWDTEGQVNIRCGDATLSDAARAVKEQAELVTKGEWLAARSSIEGKTRATLSPRIGRFKDDSAYLALQGERWRAADTLSPARPIEWSLVGALGEPAYWWVGSIVTNPDYGASAWEMKTRNRGEEFVQNRFGPLTAKVAARDWLTIERGLTGEDSSDELGKNSRDSRTPTGLRRPGPADNAVAWCALVGLGVTGVHHRAPSNREHRPASATFGSLRTREGKGKSVTWLYVPIPTRPVTLARIRESFRSQQLAQFVLAKVTSEEDGADAAWLHSRGIGGVMVARKYYTDNPNAPEPWAVPYRFETTGEGE